MEDTISPPEDFFLIGDDDGDGDKIKTILTDSPLINTGHRDSTVFLGDKVAGF